MEHNVFGQNHVIVMIKEFYFLKKYVYLKVNVILLFIKWIILIVDYVEIWKVQKNIDL